MLTLMVLSSSLVLNFFDLFLRMNLLKAERSIAALRLASMLTLELILLSKLVFFINFCVSPGNSLESSSCTIELLLVVV
jgi:hypothetical protein